MVVSTLPRSLWFCRDNFNDSSSSVVMLTLEALVIGINFSPFFLHIFLHFKLCVATATHNLKWRKMYFYNFNKNICQSSKLNDYFLFKMYSFEGEIKRLTTSIDVLKEFSRVLLSNARHNICHVTHSRHPAAADSHQQIPTPVLNSDYQWMILPTVSLFRDQF